MRDGGQGPGLKPRRGRRTKPATEQPGSSFRYLYQRLSEKEFQQLCAALITAVYPDAQCFPVGMSDGGRDITDGDQSLVYQVKWSSKVEQNPVSWLKQAIEGERTNIERLVHERGATEYCLMTSVAGTSIPGRGSVDRLNEELKKLSQAYGIHMRCLWQADIDAMVDKASDAIKWSYADMLVGHDLIRYLIHGAQIEGRAAEMRETLLKVMSAQWGEDAKVKFSQVDMDHLNIVDLFVDVEEKLERSANNALDAFIGDQQTRGQGAVQYLLGTTMPLTLVRGEPGQGKSTLGQYLCQVHRAAILPNDPITMGKAPEVSVAEPKLALRADLKDYATWLLGLDPWGESDRKPKRPKVAERSVEHFLAALCTYQSGGRSVSVEQVQDLTQRYPTLVVLDGLDEIADTNLRSEAVDQIDRFARRMGGTAQRRFQVVVTTRPNNGGQAEPSQDMFETVKLVRLNPALQREYMRKWASAHQIRSAKQRKLMNVFRKRTAQDHVAQLAENPMQLTILLYLVNRRGESVPDARTPMYEQFMDTLLDREVEKVQVVKDNVPLIDQLTSYLGWFMHAGVESSTVPDRLETRRIKRHLRNYLDEVDSPIELVDQLFRAISDRFWALSSKVDGTFEFSVHSVREYFAARFLAKYVGMFGSDVVLKSDVLRAMIERSYWTNTARFYAGFADPNELMTLVSGLQDAIEGARHPLQARVATLTLLADGVFTPVPKAQKAAAHLLADDQSIRLLQPRADTESVPTDLPPERGGNELAAEFLVKCAERPAEPMSQERVHLLARLGMRRDEFEAWWRPHLRAALGSAQETHWLQLGACYQGSALDGETTARIALDNPPSRRAAIALDARPENGSAAEQTLIHSVLDGECSDTLTASTCTAGDLLKVLRPQHYLRLAKRPGDPLYLVPVGHLADAETERRARSAVFRRLEEVDPRYKKLMQASAVRKGEGGTTAPWQHTAREIAAIHGNCLLAAEIAVIGAALNGVETGGSFTPGAPAFGSSADYGTFVQETRAHRASVGWWQDQVPICTDDLSRATWALAFVAMADPKVVEELLKRLDQVVNEIDYDFFQAVADASSRLGASALGRRLPKRIWKSTGSSSRRAQLLIAHHAADLESLDSLPTLTDAELSTIASYGDASWPAARAITARLLREGKSERGLLNALKVCGPGAVVSVPETPQTTPIALAERVLREPNAFPLGWVVAAERWQSASHTEPPLGTVAVQHHWVPEL